MSNITDGFGKPIKQVKSILIPEYEYNQLKSKAEENNYTKITSNDQLLADKYYWVRSKDFKRAFIVAQILVSGEPERKSLRVHGMDFWAYEGNSQALEIFEIYGPIPFPDVDEKETSSAGN